MGHDPQPRVGQASNQAIKVKNRVNVAGHASGQIPGKAPARGQAIHESHTTRQTTPTLPGQPQTSHHQHLQAVQTAESQRARQPPPGIALWRGPAGTRLC